MLFTVIAVVFITVFIAFATIVPPVLFEVGTSGSWGTWSAFSKMFSRCCGTSSGDLGGGVVIKIDKVTYSVLSVLWKIDGGEYVVDHSADADEGKK